LFILFFIFFSNFLNLFKAQMKDKEAKSNEISCEYETKELKDLIPDELLAWGLEEAKDRGQKYKFAAKMIYYAICEPENKIFKKQPPEIEFPEKKVISFWFKEWKKDDSKRFSKFFARLKNKPNYRQNFVEFFKKDIEKKEITLGLEKELVKRLFEKSCAIQPILNHYLLQGVEEKLDINQMKKKAEKFLLDCCSKERENMSIEEKIFIDKMIENVNKYYEEYWILYPTISCFLNMNKIWVEHFNSKEKMKKISSVYKIAVDVYLIEKYQQRQMTSSFNYFIERKDNYPFEHKEVQNIDEEISFFIPQSWKTKKGERRIDIPSIFRQVSQHYHSLNNFFHYNGAQEENLIGGKISGSKNVKSFHKKMENRNIFMSESFLRRKVNQYNNTVIEKDGVFYVNLSNGSRLELRSFKKTLSEKIQNCIKDGTLKIKSNNGNATLHVVLCGDGARQSKRNILAFQESFSPKVCGDLIVDYSKLNQLVKAKRFAFTFNSEKNELIEEILYHMGPLLEELKDPIDFHDSKGNKIKIQVICSLFKCDRKFGHILGSTLGYKDADYSCLYCLSHHSDWIDPSKALSAPPRHLNQELRFKQAKKFAGDQKEAKYLTKGESGVPKMLIKQSPCSMHSILNHGKQKIKLVFNSIGRKGIKQMDLKNELCQEVKMMCGVEPLEKGKLSKMDGDQVRLVIASLSMILMEKREEYFIERIRGDLMFKILWSYASCNHALYAQDEGNDYPTLRCIVLVLNMILYSQGLIDKFPKTKTTKSKKQVPLEESEGTKKSTKDTKSYFDFTYYHDLIKHFMFFARTCAKSDMIQENEERAWNCIKKWIRFIKEQHAFKYINSKEYCQSLSDAITSSLKSIFPFFRDMPSEIKIPLSLVQKDGEFSSFFLFTLWHLVDMDPNRIKLDENKNVSFSVPLLENYEFSFDDHLEKFQPNTREESFYKRMGEILEERKEKINCWLYKTLQTKPVLFWETEKDEPWFFSKDSVNRIKKKENLKALIRVFNKRTNTKHEPSNNIKELRETVCSIISGELFINKIKPFFGNVQIEEPEDSENDSSYLLENDVEEDVEETSEDVSDD
jgi:hypothetical protein